MFVIKIHDSASHMFLMRSFDNSYTFVYSIKHALRFDSIQESLHTLNKFYLSPAYRLTKSLCKQVNIVQF